MATAMLTTKRPRAGDEVIAIDREVAVELARSGHHTWSPNATLRYLLGLDQLPNSRRSSWPARVLAMYRGE